MKNNGFIDGFLVYECESKSIENLLKDYDFAGWDDGYLAFSKGERQLQDIKDKIKDLIKGDKQGKVAGLEGIYGYLMEIDLWRKNGDCPEEISIERDDNGFYCQRWNLFKKVPPEKYYDCLYRTVDTFPRRNSIFKDQPLESIEVIVPQNRFHFFITTGAIGL